MLNFKIIGCGAAGNKAAIDLIESGYDKTQIILLNSTKKDIVNEYKEKAVLFGKGLGGCGKERSLGKKMLLEDLETEHIVPESMVSTRDNGVVLVGSTEGGSGSSAIPILAKYFKEVVGINVICVLFFGFQDDIRGLQNSIELAQELSDDYTIIAISNARFLTEANGNRFKAESLANKKFIDIINILTGSTIKNGSQVIDDTDMYKTVYTPGYLMADTVTFSHINSVNDFNSIMEDAINNSRFINAPDEPGVKRAAYIFDVPDGEDNVDYSMKYFEGIFGVPYEKFTNLSVSDGTYRIDYILSGMKLPIEELTALYNSYIENSKKVDKEKDSFFDALANMRGNAEDEQFDMFSNSKKRKGSKKEFFSAIKQEDIPVGTGADEY